MEEGAGASNAAGVGALVGVLGAPPENPVEGLVEEFVEAPVGQASVAPVYSGSWWVPNNSIRWAPKIAVEELLLLLCTGIVAGPVSKSLIFSCV